MPPTIPYFYRKLLLLTKKKLLQVLVHAGSIKVDIVWMGLSPPLYMHIPSQ